MVQPVFSGPAIVPQPLRLQLVTVDASPLQPVSSRKADVASGMADGKLPGHHSSGRAFNSDRGKAVANRSGTPVTLTETLLNSHGTKRRTPAL